MASIQVGYTNVLENAISVTANSLTNYNTNRLYDRDFGKLWICSSSSAPQYITINQSSSPIAANYIVINKHRTSGITYRLEYGSTGSSWSSIDTWTQSDNNIIGRSISSTTANYWRLSHSSGTGTLILGELFLTNLITFTAQPKYGSTSFKSYNVKRIEPYTGKTTYTSYCTSRRRMEYDLTVKAADYAYWKNVSYYYSNYGPFFFIDHEGNKMFVELLDSISFQPLAKDIYSLKVSLQEVIA